MMLVLWQSLVLSLIACLVLEVKASGIQKDHSLERSNKEREVEDVKAETYRFWNRQLQNSVIIPTQSPTTSAPTAFPPVSVSQNWCGNQCIDASVLNNAQETKNAYKRALVSEGEDISTISIVFTNGGPCAASQCSSNGRRNLQQTSSEARDIIVTVSGLQPTFSTGEPAISESVKDKIVAQATEIETVVAADPVLDNLGVVVDIEATVTATNPPTFAPTQSPTQSPTAVSTIITKSPKTKTPKSKTPKSKTPKTKSPKTKSPESKTPKTKSPKTKSPESKSPKSKSPKSISRKTKSTERLHMFDKDYTLPVYYVNLDGSVDRKNQMETMFSKITEKGYQINATRIRARTIGDVNNMVDNGQFIPNGVKIVPTDEEESWLKHHRKEYPTIEVAVLLSHLDSILQAYENGDEVALILEDDAILKDEFLSDWQEYAKKAPSDWRILQWANSNNAVLKHTSQYQRDPWVTWQPEFYGAIGYMMNREGMEEVLMRSRKIEDGDFYWYIDEPEVVCADELVYYLAGGAYSSTFPWITTSGLVSTFGDSINHPVFKSDHFEYRRLTSVSNLQDKILILMSCKLSNEAQIIDEIYRLQTDIDSFSKSNSNFRWIVNAVIAFEHLEPFFKKTVLFIKNPSVEIRTRVDSKPFNKYGLVAEFIDEMNEFDYVLIKDNDMRLSGFPWNTFMQKKGDSVVSGALHQGLEESLARNLGKRKRQYYEFHEGQMWKYEAVAEYTSLTPIPTLFIEHGFALVEAEFAGWFFNQVLDTKFISQRSDWGIDKMWCSAAKEFYPNRPSCTLIPVTITHDDTRQLSINQNPEVFGQKAFEHFRETPRFRDWMDATIGWENFIGNDSTLSKVLQRCRAFLYSKNHHTKHDLSTCASLIVEGEQNMPGNLYTCGWDALALSLFPDFTYSSTWVKDGNFYTEKDLIVADVHGSCISTGHVDKSFEYMAANFPGKILYVNAESHNNIMDWDELDKEERSFQIGPWNENKYDRTTQVYLAAMTLFVVDKELWGWIFDPTMRKINNGRHQAIAYFVSNCVDFRQDAAKELSNIVELHHGGGCHVEGKNTRRVEAENHLWTENWKLFRDYKYCLVMENKAQPGYITEKIIMAFLGGCVPIYYGTEEVFDLFNPKAFVFYDINNPKPAHDKIQLLENDPDAYNKVFEEPILRDGNRTIERFFSLSDEGPVNPTLKSRIRQMMGLED